MDLLVDIALWVQTTPVAAWLVGPRWTWTVCETLHFLGMALLIGTVGLLDARLLGLYKELPLGPLERLVPWGIAGFVVNVVSGLYFVVLLPVDNFHNTFFWWKMAFIGLAGANVLFFYFSGLARQVGRLGPGEPTPTLAKAVGASSLFLWFGVIYWGRMLVFGGSKF